MALSDQLTTLAARARDAEDRAAAARTRAQDDLEHEVASARESADAQAEKLRRSAEEHKGRLSVWWHDMQRSWNEHVAKVRDDIDAKRAGHDSARAEHRAERAEADAAFAIDYAIAAIDEAEYAVLDAMLTRQQADQMAAGRSGATA